jgi:hypothetical protein
MGQRWALLDALGTRGMSNDETDDESEHRNPDRRFKTLWRVDTGFFLEWIHAVRRYKLTVA